MQGGHRVHCVHIAGQNEAVAAEFAEGTHGPHLVRGLEPFRSGLSSVL